VSLPLGREAILLFGFRIGDCFVTLAITKESEIASEKNRLRTLSGRHSRIDNAGISSLALKNPKTKKPSEREGFL
jgi:hypothetical protein